MRKSAPQRRPTATWSESSIERTLCDMLKYKGDPELFLNAIKVYMASADKNLNKLFSIANSFGMHDKIRPYVETLL